MNPIAVALDLPTLDEARNLASRLRGSVGMVKVGLELFVEAGPRALVVGEDADAPVFLDLKLHDIPETVERAVARAADAGVRVLTVHAAGGPRMLRAAVRRAEKENPSMRICAVTVLTSLDTGDLPAVGLARNAPSGVPDRSVADVVSALAQMAHGEGVRSFVCSVHEVATLRAAFGPETFLVTPGIRLPGASGADDQKRTATPAEAIRRGASLLVVGRPVRDAADPRATALSLLREATESSAAVNAHDPGGAP
ncbi:MAG: orotidine-5'-phosphate decarboxylase [Polyangiaceae bacterium]